MRKFLVITRKFLVCTRNILVRTRKIFFSLVNFDPSRLSYFRDNDCVKRLLASAALFFFVFFLAMLCTVKNIRRFYSKIIGNQLQVQFPLFCTGARKHFLE